MRPRDDTLKDAFLAYLKAALRVTREHAEGHGLPSTSCSTPRRDRDGKVTFETVDKLEPFALWDQVHGDVEGLKELDNLRLGIAASEHSNSLLCNADGKVIQDTAARRELVDEWARQALVEYIGDDGLLTFDARRARKVYDQFVRFAEHKQIRYSVSALLGNFAGPEGNTAIGGGVTLRPLNDAELEHLWTVAQRGGMFSWHDAFSVSHCLTRGCNISKGALVELGNTEERLEKAVVALRLHKAGHVKIMATMHLPVRPAFGQAWPMMSTRAHAVVPGPRYTLGNDEGSQVAAIHSALCTARPDERTRLALGRFNTAYEKADPGDRLIDYWIALEALFLTDGERGELSYRASMRIAYFLGTAETREQLSRDARQSYNTRSDIVHGKECKDVLRIAAETEDVVRRILQLCVASRKAPNARVLDSRIAHGS